MTTKPAVACFRCAGSFTPGELKVCAAQPHELQIVVCAEKPWIDPREQERLKLRIKTHELILSLSACHWQRRPSIRG